MISSNPVRDPRTLPTRSWWTNDSDIRDFCSGLGCTVTGSENLLDQLSAPRKLSRPVARQDSDDAGPANLSTVKKATRTPSEAASQPARYRF